MQFGLGYDPTLEAQHEWTMASLPQIVCAPSGTLPSEVDPRPFIKANNQGYRNTCCGNARDKVVEFCEWIKTGEVVNLSARFAYLTTKLVDGTINGPDAGASIRGAAIASTRYGECLEALCPYWKDNEPYSTGIPKAAYEQGVQYKLRSYQQTQNYDQDRVFIGSGQGGILFGIQWTERLANFRGRVLTMADLGGQYLGEHAICLIGYLLSGNGLVYNSHGLGWAINGVAEVEPAVLDYWHKRSRHGFYAFSDLPAFRQRRIKGFDKGFV